jgi:hypothetical protein
MALGRDRIGRASSSGEAACGPSREGVSETWLAESVIEAAGATGHAMLLR